MELLIVYYNFLRHIVWFHRLHCENLLLFYFPSQEADSLCFWTVGHCWLTDGSCFQSLLHFEELGGMHLNLRNKQFRRMPANWKVLLCVPQNHSVLVNCSCSSAGYHRVLPQETSPHLPQRYQYVLVFSEVVCFWIMQ